MDEETETQMKTNLAKTLQFSSVQSLNRVQLFATP